MRIGFIGAGKVGFTLGKYIMERNGCVSGYFSRNAASAQQASEFTHTQYYTELGDLIASSDALFLTCPDGAIKDVWNSLRRYSLTGKCICHCSGAMSSAVFSEIDQMGAFGYSIHPLFAIHSKYESYREISNAFFTIEGHPQYLGFWQDFFEYLGNSVSVISAENKTLYHSSAVIVSNLVCGLYQVGAQLLVQCGFDEESASRALVPLFIGNAETVAQVGAISALTGPVERGDAVTVRHHLEVLPERDREIYQRLSKVLVDIAQQKNPQRDYSLLRQTLDETF